MLKDKVHKEIGQKIRRFRKAKKLSISMAARAYGCTPKRWVLLEMGNPMTVHSLLRAAEVVGVLPWKLLK